MMWRDQRLRRRRKSLMWRNARRSRIRRGIAAMMRLLLVEDHAPVRRALREGLEATGEARVIAEAATAREAIALAEANGEIEVALMDVELRDPEVGAEAASGVGDPARASALSDRLLLHPGRRHLLPRVPRLRNPEPLRLRAQEQLPLAL